MYSPSQQHGQLPKAIFFLFLGLQILLPKFLHFRKKKNIFDFFYVLRCKKTARFKKKKFNIKKKKNNKNCLILHGKNAEMTVVISAFLQCKIIQFLLFLFSPIQICFRLNKKNFFSNFYFYFFPSSDLNILKKNP